MSDPDTPDQLGMQLRFVIIMQSSFLRMCIVNGVMVVAVRIQSMNRDMMLRTYGGCDM
jgi:type III secretory pathway component EscR